MVLTVLRTPLACLALLISVSSAFAADRLDFNKDIRAILSENCIACHGPDSKTQEAGLRLDVSDQTMWKGESGKLAIVPGNPDASEMLRRINSTDPNEVMPPPATGKSLTPQQKATLKQWIAEGAEYKGHWAFLAPVKAAPAPAKIAWGNGPIDQYVLADLEKAGLAPSPEADKVTLIRRATFDLTGLPPTIAEVDAFVADTSPDAYEKLIDRLMSSPRYGEHMARFWLDVASYGDTHGLHLDNERSIWKYREWVINAFNTNQPYDQFTIEQLAGDLLPNPTLEQKIATGFVRCNVTTSEGGSIDEEVRVRYGVDRTERLSTVFLGLTLGCAVCHDHKFDPVSQKEFYSLYSYFNSAADPAMDGNRHDTPPTVKVPSPEDIAKLAELDAKIAEAQKAQTEALAKVEYTEPTEVAPMTGPYEHIWIEDGTPPGAKQEGNSPWEFVSAPDHPVHTGTKSTRRDAGGAQMSQHFFTGAKPELKAGEGDKLFAYVYLDPKNPPKTVMLQFNVNGSWEHRGFWGEDTIAFGSGDVPGHRKMGDLPKTGEWVRLEVDAKHVGVNSGDLINGWAFTQFGGLCYWDHAGIVTQTPQDGRGFDSLLAWEAYEKAQEKSSVPQPVRDAIKVEADKRNDDQKKLIKEYFLANIYNKTRETLGPLKKAVEDLNAQKKAIDDAVPVSLVMADMPTERETFVLIRGEYNKPGDKVTRGTPSLLPKMPEGVPNNRLGLAKWLVDPSHPLMSRVTVNRFWQQLFGRGIVKTSEDFGSQGDFPAHPELLDYLAVDFRESGWDVKRLIKQIMLSATYRQTSKVSAELAARDPENVLLARGPRFRMDAELVRDNALAVAGLLSPRIGGKSVKPYQPEGIWEAVAFQGSNTNSYKRDDGEALYRRSMYTFWKRTSPPPSLMAFDAPSRENCIARRARTNTPLQALVLMNDEQYVEASRQLAKRMITEGGSQPADRLRYGFRLIAARAPSERELSVLSAQLTTHQEHFKANAEAAKKLLAIGATPRDESIDPAEHASYTLVGNLLLNLDETMTKE